MKKLFYVLFLVMLGPKCSHAAEPKTCSLKSIKEKFEFFVASSVQSEKLSNPRAVNGVTLYFEKNPQITNRDLESVSSPHIESGLNTMNVTFTASGAQKLEKITKENIARYLAIVVDGMVISVPVLREPIQGGLVTLSYENNDKINKKMKKICP